MVSDRLRCSLCELCCTVAVPLLPARCRLCCAVTYQPKWVALQVKKQGLLPVLDNAYQGYASGDLAKDGASVTMCEESARACSYNAASRYSSFTIISAV